MMNWLKRLVPRTALSGVRALRVRRNRRQLLHTARGTRELTVFPDNSAEHYYHFLFDLALPLFLLLEDLDDDVNVMVDATGPFIPRLEQLFASRVRLAPSDEARPKYKLLGMNPIFVAVGSPEFRAFSRHARRVAGAPDIQPNKVLLIERLPPQEFFRTQARHTGGGASRRSIPNHAEVQSLMEEWVEPPLEFMNVRLEELDFATQIRLFASAKIIVGQHGAGLGNAVWMDPGGTVVEMTNRPELRHFEIISRGMQHHHLTLPTAGAHTPIDLAMLRAALGEVEATGPGSR